MTKTPLIAFRCPPDLRKALDADAVKNGKPVTELILRTLCKKYGVEYVPAANGRPKKAKG